MGETFTDLALETLTRYPVNGKFSTVMPQGDWTMNDWFWNADKIAVAAGKDDTFVTARRIPETRVYTTPGATRNATVQSHFINGTQPLVHMYYADAWFEEELEQQGASATDERAAAQAIVNIINGRRKLNLLGFYVQLEDDLWKYPVLTGDSKTLWGLPCHVTAITPTQMATATVAGAFQGGNPLASVAAGTGTLAADWCGIDLSVADNAGMRNYNAGWDGATSESITMTRENRRRIAKQMRAVNFGGPALASQLGDERYDRFRIVTDEYIVERLGEVQQSANDNLGGEVLKFMGTGLKLGDSNNGVMLNGLPIRYERRLNIAASTGIPSGTTETNRVGQLGYHPMGFYNLTHLRMEYRAGKFMKSRKPATDDVHQPDAVVQYTDTIANLRCQDHQKAGAIISFRGSDYVTQS